MALCSGRRLGALPSESPRPPYIFHTPRPTWHSVSHTQLPGGQAFIMEQAYSCPSHLLWARGQRRQGLATEGSSGLNAVSSGTTPAWATLGPLFPQLSPIHPGHQPTLHCPPLLSLSPSSWQHLPC
jgi:hypothetical protein